MRRAVILSTAVVALSGQVANRANAFRLRSHCGVKSARNPLHSQAVAGVASDEAGVAADEGEQEKVKDETPDEMTEAFRDALAAFKDETITDGDVNGESAAMVQHVNYMFGGREGKTEKGKGYRGIVRAFHKMLKPYRNRISKKDFEAFKKGFEERLSSVAEIGDKQKKESLVLQKQSLLAAQDAALKEVRSDATAKIAELEMHYTKQLSACKSCERQLTFAEEKVSEKEAQIAELAEKNRLAEEKISEKEAQIAELVENNGFKIRALAKSNYSLQRKESALEAENHKLKAKNHKLEAENHELDKSAQEAMERYEKAVKSAQEAMERYEKAVSGENSEESDSGDESGSGSSSGDESGSGSGSGDSDESTDSREDR